MKVTILNEKESIETLKKTPGTVWQDKDTDELYVLVHNSEGYSLSAIGDNFGGWFDVNSEEPFRCCCFKYVGKIKEVIVE